MRAALAVIALLSALSVAPAPAASRDSHAPEGASDNWLPCEAWVMFHWLPFDEARLYALLRTREPTVRAWLRDDDHHTLAQLFARRGLAVAEAADALLAPRVSGLDAELHATLERRTEAMLTQGHLAQHVLFHFFHQPLVALNAPSIFGVSAPAYRSARLRGRSPAQIGARHGRTRGQVAYRAVKVLERAATIGVRGGHTTRSQARRLLAIQRRGTRHWLASRIRKPGAGKHWTPTRTSRTAMLCFLFRGDSGDEAR